MSLLAAVRGAPSKDRKLWCLEMWLVALRAHFQGCPPHAQGAQYLDHFLMANMIAILQVACKFGMRCKLLMPRDCQPHVGVGGWVCGECRWVGVSWAISVKLLPVFFSQGAGSTGWGGFGQRRGFAPHDNIPVVCCFEKRLSCVSLSGSSRCFS